jgi:pimeloyl-ACP methyl ester carboxylesterase
MAVSRANNIDIIYEKAGSGPPLVMIHAMPFDHNLWLYQVERFSAHFTVIAMDLRGWGASAKPRMLHARQQGTRRKSSIRSKAIPATGGGSGVGKQSLLGRFRPRCNAITSILRCDFKLSAHRLVARIRFVDRMKGDDLTDMYSAAGMADDPIARRSDFTAM